MLMSSHAFDDVSSTCRSVIDLLWPLSLIVVVSKSVIADTTFCVAGCSALGAVQLGRGGTARREDILKPPLPRGVRSNDGEPPRITPLSWKVAVIVAHFVLNDDFATAGVGGLHCDELE